MKRIIALIIIITCTASLLIACGSKQLNMREIKYIVLKNEKNNTFIEITDPQTIEKIVSSINSLSLKKGKPIQVPTDWSYQLIWYGDDNKIIRVMGIVDAITIGYDDYYYSILDGNIDIDFFDELVNSKQGIINIDDAISAAIKERSSSYAPGEAVTEGHIVLEIEEENGTVKVYTIASYGVFGFENNIFTKISGTGAIPTVITFAKGEGGAYSLLEYKEPMDGGGYGDSIREIFPTHLHNRAFSARDDYPVLARQQKSQAEEYLKNIGRVGKVSEKHVEKELPNIDVEASNILFTELTKHNPFLNDCPYWLGTREKLEDGVRYIYETSQSKTSDGYDLIIFQKKREGTIVEESKYKIVGSKPELLD